MTRLTEKETDLQILTDKPLDEGFCRQRIRFYRSQIEDYISRDRKFLSALKPIGIEMNAPKIIRAMGQAASQANVGPMAAVAGAIAGFLGRDLLKKGFREVIVENGGDIFLKVVKTRSLGIYAGKSKLWNQLKIKILPQDTPLGICASSGTIGHSLSFGRADCVIVISKNPALADAVATAACNRVQGKESLPCVLNFVRGIKKIFGIVIIFKNNLASYGKIEFSRR